MSSQFNPVPLVGTSQNLIEDINAWIRSEPLRALTVEFGATPDLTSAATTDLATTLANLDQFTDRWDTRSGRERNLACELDITSSQAELIRNAADALGLSTVRRPRHRHYDYVLMLGGLVRACVARPAYAAHLIHSGQVTAGAVIALGGHRPFGGDEFDYARTLGISGVAEEYEAMDVGTRRAFGLDEPQVVKGETSDHVGGTWGVRHYRTAAGLPVIVAAAPSSEPSLRRANTPDSYSWFAEYLVALKPGQRLLMVTTPIYVPAQHAAAMRMLHVPYSVEVETVGNDPAVTGAVKQPATPTKLLLEVRSAVRALRDLYTTVAGSY